MRSCWLAVALAGMVSLLIRAQAPSPQPRARITESSAELEDRNQAVTEDDLLILERAGRLLASPAVWNRHDTRECATTDTTWSLFCALEEASLVILGEYRHREVALQEVRFAIQDMTGGREFEHRLMDYNNLPSTQFTDVKRVLAVAAARVRARLDDQNTGRR